MPVITKADIIPARTTGRVAPAKSTYNVKKTNAALAASLSFMNFLKVAKIMPAIKVVCIPEMDNM